MDYNNSINYSFVSGRLNIDDLDRTIASKAKTKGCLKSLSFLLRKKFDWRYIHVSGSNVLINVRSFKKACPNARKKVLKLEAKRGIQELVNYIHLNNNTAKINETHLSFPLPSGSKKVQGIKSGFPNSQSTSCWLSTTLQLLNTIPSSLKKAEDLKQFDSETANEFLHRQKTATMTLKLLEQSKSQEAVDPHDIEELRQALCLFEVPEAPNVGSGSGVPCLPLFSYIFEIGRVHVKEKLSMGIGSGNRFYPYASVVNEAPHEEVNPLLIITDSFDTIIERTGKNVSVFPYTFDCSKEEAPEFFVIPANMTAVDLNPDNLHCLVSCGDGSCYYEIAGMWVGGGHYFSLIKEQIENKAAWVKYDDNYLTIHRDLSFHLDILNNKNAGMTYWIGEMIYRKLPDN